MKDDTNENNAAEEHRINNNKTATSRSFEYKTKMTGKTPINNDALNTKVAVPLKYLSNFWRSLDSSFINCEIKLDLSWSKNCVFSKIVYFLKYCYS